MGHRKVFHECSRSDKQHRSKLNQCNKPKHQLGNPSISCFLEQVIAHLEYCRVVDHVQIEKIEQY